MGYEDLLKRARDQLPESVLVKERFEIPKIRGHLEGNKTVLSNFIQIAQHLRREPEHMLKYILKELATPGDFKKNLVIMGSKVSSTRINEKVQQYANKFVICKECGKPDTKLSKKDRVTYIKCTACGAKYPLNI